MYMLLNINHKYSYIIYIYIYIYIYICLHAELWQCNHVLLHVIYYVFFVICI